MKPTYVTPEIKQYILDHYDGTSKTITHIQEKFSIPRQTVTSNARRLGVASQKIKIWSEADIDYLRDNWGNKTESTIGKKLSRTQTAVHLKAKRLKLGGRKVNYSLLEIGNYLGICSKSVKTWGNKGFLRITNAKTDANIFSVRLEDFEEFLKKYPQCWDSRKMKYSLWITEPEWLKQKKREDNLTPKNQFQKWNDLETGKLLELFRKGVSHKEIGVLLNRSTEAIEHKLLRINYGRK